MFPIPEVVYPAHQAQVYIINTHGGVSLLNKCRIVIYQDLIWLTQGIYILQRCIIFISSFTPIGCDHLSLHHKEFHSKEICITIYVYIFVHFWSINIIGCSLQKIIFCIISYIDNALMLLLKWNNRITGIHVIPKILLIHILVKYICI